MIPYQHLIRKMMSAASLQKTAYYVPSVQGWRSLKYEPNSSLRIACIVDDYLYNGLKFEGILLPLTESNWKNVLTYGKPDLLLINSSMESVTGDWHMSQLVEVSGKESIFPVLDLAKSLRIPTVYWFTRDHRYHRQFKGVCSLFDWVFCADPEEVELLSADGVESSLLLPCVQPALYNPFRHYDCYHSLEIDLLLDGWADLDRYSKEFEELRPLIEGGSLKIIESKYVITKNRVEASPLYREATLGYVSEPTKQSILKYVKLYIGLTPSIQDETERMWAYVAVAASRVCILHLGKKLRHSSMDELVLHVDSPKNLMVNLEWFKLDPCMREKYAHLAWREATLKHTFSHRLGQICARIGVGHDWIEYPKASLICPSYRVGYLSKCIETYRRQTYGNKELILVFNSDENPPEEIIREASKIPDAVILTLPRNSFAGDCINYGVKSSTGEYIFRIDDDDYYAQNYILDRMLCHRGVDFDFIANPHTLFVYFEEDNGVYFRKTKSPPFAINPMGDVPVKFTGNTYSGRRSLFECSPFRLNNYSAADVFFLDNIPPTTLTGSADYFNMAAERRVDQTTHTWRVESQNRLKPKEAVFRHYECVAC
ncbi:glycosyltransferase family A protein [Accumulibacter sp.]|uniref:glycosyltransferase family A protein n=1 Tax=Accumulibacter sp. TaxID=2053492 RepID=UPI00262ACFD8|nr:glycosyltransferase family A protein [Accumulibacter sp.]